MFEDFRKRARRMLRVVEMNEWAEAAEREKQLALSEALEQAMGKTERLAPPRRLEAQQRQAEAAQIARGAAQVAQEERVRQAWAAGLGALPHGMRDLVAGAIAAVQQTEAELAEHRQRLTVLQAGPAAGEARDAWALRRGHVLDRVAALEHLKAEQTAAYRRLVEYTVFPRLRDVLAQQEQDAAQAEADAAAYYEELLKRARAERAQRRQARDAIGTARAQAMDARTLEAQLGLVVTPAPDPRAERERRRAAQAAVLPYLKRSAS